MTNQMNTLKSLPSILLSAILFMPILASGQQVEEKEKNPLGFRTDLGIGLAIGGHNCLGSSGKNWLECKGNNTGWSMGTGFALSAIIRPLQYFSMGIDAAYMALRPTEGTDFDHAYKRFWDLSIGGVFRGHYPIRIKRLVLDVGLGLRIAFVSGFLNSKPPDPATSDFQYVTGDNSSSYTHRHFGPEIAPLFNLDLYVLPKMGVGFEMRMPLTLYQQVCFDQGDNTICRGVDDDETDKPSAPLKLFYGLHVIYYM